MKSTKPIALFLLVTALFTQAQSDPNAVKPIPPPGKEIPAADRAELAAGVAKLGKEIDALAVELKDKPELGALLPDIQIYHNAVRYPLTYEELIDVKAARQALSDADARLKQLRDGKPEWVKVTGPRGYVSRIDRSVQPYVLSVPEGYKPADKATKYRFDFWCHGRGEDLMELKFLRSRELTSKTHFVVNLYGRYCNANKFAGEIDLLEALADVKRRYPVDERRLVDIGFSMGGAAAWQFAVHYTDLFAAAAPGAGFSESREFLRIKQAEVDAMAPWQRALWHLYDCTDYAANLHNLPTVAYSGELDGQKQAADMMEKAMAAEGLKLEHLIGPGTKHAYHKETRQKLDARLAEICEEGQIPIPDHPRLTTWTLRYNRMYWLSVEGLERHWERADVTTDMTIVNSTKLRTKNVSAIRLDIPPNKIHFPDAEMHLSIDDKSPTRTTVKTAKDGSYRALFAKVNGAWVEIEKLDGLRKRHGLQGPIDDAFMDSFVIVKPTGKPGSEKTGKWAAAECEHAIVHWRKQFRGEARVVNDTDVTDADIRESNLVCFGDAASNAVIARVAKDLPVKWDGGKLTLGEKAFDAAHHVPALIYPNPLNPARYVVLNSGFTFREFDYLNNARQTPKLPDYAVIDVDSPVTPKAPGKVVEAGFFDERWQLPK
jgi:dienelactone hydrolase